jgi:hypothetical protein
MTKAYQTLQKAERAAYQLWLAWTREIDSARHKAQNAPISQKRHAEALVRMAGAASASAFDRWLNVCYALDTLEWKNARDPAAEY